MSRKRVFIISLTLVCISQILIFSFGYFNLQGVGAGGEDQPPNNPPEIPEGPEFVVPESPLGTFALLGASAAAFGVFALAKKRRLTPNLRL